MSDQAKLPERPLIVYKAGLDGRHAAGKLIKSVSGGLLVSRVGMVGCKDYHYHFHYRDGLFRAGVRWGLEAPN